MGPVQAVASGFKNIANFSGRATRSEFWWWMLFIFILEVIVSALFGRSSGGTVSLNGFGFVIAVILWLATIAVGCRRLHDTGKTGWLQLLAIIPCIGAIILIVFWVQPSQGDNQYGPPNV